MNKSKHLYLLWTSGEKFTFDEMVFMYALNGIKNQWWDELTLIIWGASAQLAATNIEVGQKLKRLDEAGVQISTCKACADHLNVTKSLQKLGVEVIYWGVPLTKLLQSDAKILTI
jgi:hypothetical protein